MSRAWAFVRAVLGVVSAITIVFIAYLFGRRGRGLLDGSSGAACQVIGDNQGTIDAIADSERESSEVQRGNASAIKKLEDALDTLRRARRGNSD